MFDNVNNYAFLLRSYPEQIRTKAIIFGSVSLSPAILGIALILLYGKLGGLHARFTPNSRQAQVLPGRYTLTKQ
jgi:hypothetical protein